ncbi:VanZ family protein [Eubacterium sp.]
MGDIIRTIYCTDKTIVLLSLVVLSILCSVYKFLYQSKKQNNFIVGIAFVLCIVIALYPSVLIRAGGETRELVLEPFRSLKLYFDTGYEEWIRVIVMNIAMFYPLGCVYACFNKNKKTKPWMFFVFAFLFSFFIETVQYAFSLGVSETDDVINNTLGALLGYLITYLFYKLLNKSGEKQ